MNKCVVLAAAIAIASLVACGGRVVVDHGGGGHGASGGGTQSTSDIGAGPPTSSSTGIVDTTSTTGPSPTCLTCAQVFTGGDAAKICPGLDADERTALLGCACTANSLCLSECGGNFCANGATTVNCQNCMQGGCSVELGNCIGVAGEVSSSVGPTTAASTGPGMNCLTCSQLIQQGGDPSQLCPGSDALYQDFLSCVCSGNCAMKCHQTCQTGNTTNGCQSCIFDPDPQGCDDELNACFAN